MAMLELDSFVVKFKQLCVNGKSATLNVEKRSGNISVRLEAELDITEEFKPFNNGKQRSPSYFRRRFQRQEVKNKNKTESLGQNEAVEASLIISEAVKPDGIDENKAGDFHANEDVADFNISPLDEPKEVFNDEGNEASSLQNNAVLSDYPSIVKENDMKTACKLPNSNCNFTDIACDEKKKCDGDMDNDFVMVYATASLKNAPFSRVEDDILSSISEIVNCKDHLRRNIRKIDFTNIRNRPMRGSSRFMHEVDIVLHVNKCNLWESARSYLWKNLGSSSWTLHDGTEIALLRIHQKF